MTIVGTGELTFEPIPDWADDAPITEAVGVAVDSRDRIHVFNRTDSPDEPQIIVLDADGNVLDTWGTGAVTRPHGIWIAPDDSVYLTDDLGHGVCQFAADGSHLRDIGPSGVASETGANGFDHRPITQAAGPYNLPTNTVTAADGSLFVTDGYGNAAVHKFDSDGNLLKTWGAPGSGPGEFIVPHGLGIDRDQRLYVADRENSRVQIFDTDGAFITEWTDVIRPCEVFVGADDLVYIAELGTWAGLFPWMERTAHSGVGRLSIFDREGNLQARWGGGQDPLAPDGFYTPHDVWLDSAGNIYLGEVCKTAAMMAGEDGTALPSIRKYAKIS